MGQLCDDRADVALCLLEHKQLLAGLRHELEEIQRQLTALKQDYLAEKSKLETRIKELQEAQEAAEQKVTSLSEALEYETRRREAVERLAQAAILATAQRHVDADAVTGHRRERRFRLGTIDAPAEYGHQFHLVIHAPAGQPELDAGARAGD